MGCALCSGVTVRRAVGWAMQLAVCSGKTLWSSRLKAVFSNEWGYELVSLSGHNRSSSKVAKVLYGLGAS